MKTHSKEAIEAKVLSLWHTPEEYYKYPNVDVSIRSNGDVAITVSQMYESPRLNLPLLMELAEFFDTKNINDDDRFANNGCETCDYGSSYGFTLTVRPEKKS